MVSYAAHPLRKAMADARAAGMDLADVRNMVTDVYTAEHNQSEPPPTADVVYDELPDGLIDLPSACRKYGVNRQTANGWMRKGQIPYLGKIKAPARGGGYNVTSLSAFLARKDADPAKGGRPIKTRIHC